MKNIKSSSMEVFCKAIILFIAQGEKERNINNIAIINCKTPDFINIIRFFAVCYDKNGMSNWLRDTQVYLSGEDTREEFLLSGENVHTLLARVSKLAFSRRIHPNCVKTLQQLLEKKQSNDGNIEKNQDQESPFYYTPFDLLLKKGGRTIFENNVKTVLENNIQNIESGCKVDPTHMRLGSKIHIDKFYEAELLFYNNYYTNRFAYLLFDVLRDIIRKDHNLDPRNVQICFVGYDTYSEMLLCELKNIWNSHYHTDCVYIVYEIKTDGKINLRYKELVNRSNMMPVFLVPINSTLTTFNKIKAEVKGLLDVEKSLANLGVIQVRDETEDPYECSILEGNYWDKVDVKNRRIYSTKILGEGQYATYLVDVCSKWEDPLECKLCFPEDCLMEVPLIETNKTSVVPSQLIGLKEKLQNQRELKRRQINGSGDIESLKDYFYYGHVIRDQNHFCYYIRTASYFKNYKEHIEEWLKNVKQVIRKDQEDDVVSYNIIVNPMHFSNTGFVEAVNDVVFDGASYVLRIDTEKEFRDNIQTKYSDLSSLYENLRKSNYNAKINFYYVDDNIITGKTFHRIKHLISSLFAFEENQKVSIFKSVIVLLNRLSKYSINNYVKNLEDFYSYIDLDISNLRSHEDACFLCKKEVEYQKLADYSSTNMINGYWEKKKDKHVLKTLSEIKVLTQKKKDAQKINRPFLRMKSNHIINKEFGLLGHEKNNVIKAYEKLVSLIIAEDDKYEMLTTFVYVASHPFVVYRKAYREAVFHMVVILLEIFVVQAKIEEKHPEEKGLIERVRKAYCDNEISKELRDELIGVLNASKILPKIVQCINNKKEFLKFLVKISVELKSNYIIRADRMQRVVNKYYSIIIKENLDSEEMNKELDSFMKFYVSSVKKLISLSSDESKSTYFEKMLHTYFDLVRSSRDENISKEDKYFYKIVSALYLENTSGLVDAINDLNKNKLNLDDYFLENYVKMMEINGMPKSEQVSVSKYFVEVFKHLQNSEIDTANKSQNQSRDFHRYIEYYNQLSEKIKDLTNAKSVKFFLGNKEWELRINKSDKVVFDKEVLHYELFAQSDSNKNRSTVLEAEDIFEHSILDTICIAKKNIYIIYKKFTNEEKKKDGQGNGKSIVENSNFQPIYLAIEYGENIEWKHLCLVRRILLFRNMMMRRFFSDFGNNVMQNWIEQARVIKQLEKARAFIHTKDNDSDDMTNVWNLCRGYLYGTLEEINEHENEYGFVKTGCILELMTDIRIGRINLLLLSNSNFRTDTNETVHPFKVAKGYIERLKEAYYWKNVCVCNENNIERTENIIPDSIYNEKLESNINGKYNLVKEYLVYLIYEAIHSAAMYGKKVEGKVRIQIYKEGKYLFICNEMGEEHSKESIEKGLARKGNGISLAVICEYFIKQYENRFVKLCIKDNHFKMGLPIFVEDKQNES